MLSDKAQHLNTGAGFLLVKLFSARKKKIHYSNTNTLFASLRNSIGN